MSPAFLALIEIGARMGVAALERREPELIAETREWIARAQDIMADPATPDDFRTALREQMQDLTRAEAERMRGDDV